MNFKDKNIVVFGAGAVGSTVGGWLAPHHENLYFFDRPEILDSLDKNGLELFWGEQPEKIEKVKVKTIRSLKEIARVDYIFLCVKNYSLDVVSKMILEQIGDVPIIVGFQNGVENQKILPDYFSKVIYSVVGYNVWPEGEGRWGYQKRGPLVFGTLNPNELVEEKKALVAALNEGVESVLVQDFQSAAYSKLIVNLTNSLTTLIGHKQQEVSSMKLFQKILTNMTYEGVKVMKSAGLSECSIGGMPSWRTMTAAAKLPQFITRPIFLKNIKKMVVSSMAQDIIQRKSSDSELDTINGRLLELAEKHNVDVPYNREIYRLCRQEFSKDEFQPIDVKKVWDEIRPNV